MLNSLFFNLGQLERQDYQRYRTYISSIPSLYWWQLLYLFLTMLLNANVVGVLASLPPLGLPESHCVIVVVSLVYAITSSLWLIPRKVYPPSSSFLVAFEITRFVSIYLESCIIYRSQTISTCSHVWINLCCFSDGGLCRWPLGSVARPKLDAHHVDPHRGHPASMEPRDNRSCLIVADASRAVSLRRRVVHRSLWPEGFPRTGCSLFLERRTRAFIGYPGLAYLSGLTRNATGGGGDASLFIGRGAPAGPETDRTNLSQATAFCSHAVCDI